MDSSISEEQEINNLFKDQQSNDEFYQGPTDSLEFLFQKPESYDYPIGCCFCQDYQIHRAEENEPEVIIQPPSQKKPDVYLFPKETKNFYKNIFSTLQNFLKDEFPNECQSDTLIQQFISTKNKQSKAKFLSFFKTASLLKTIAQYFFLNKCWIKYLIKNNKTDLEQYFRLSQLLI